MKTLVLYHTKTGHTLEALNPFIKSLKNKGLKTKLVEAKDFTPEMLSDHEAFVVGTPCWGGSIGSTGVAKPIIKALSKLDNDALKEKLCGGIVVYAKYGGKTTMSHLEKLLTKKGCVNFKKGPIAKAGVLASIVKGKSVSTDDEKLFAAFSNEFVTNI